MQARKRNRAPSRLILLLLEKGSTSRFKGGGGKGEVSTRLGSASNLNEESAALPKSRTNLNMV